MSNLNLNQGEDFSSNETVRNQVFPAFYKHLQDEKLGRNPRSDRDLCEKGNKSQKKK